VALVDEYFAGSPAGVRPARPHGTLRRARLVCVLEWHADENSDSDRLGSALTLTNITPKI